MSDFVHGLRLQAAKILDRFPATGAEEAKLLLDAADRLTLSDGERVILAGHGDGCIRVNDLQPILRRVFG